MKYCVKHIVIYTLGFVMFSCAQKAQKAESSMKQKTVSEEVIMVDESTLDNFIIEEKASHQPEMEDKQFEQTESDTNVGYNGFMQYRNVNYVKFADKNQQLTQNQKAPIYDLSKDSIYKAITKDTNVTYGWHTEISNKNSVPKDSSMDFGVVSLMPTTKQLKAYKNKSEQTVEEFLDYLTIVRNPTLDLEMRKNTADLILHKCSSDSMLVQSIYLVEEADPTHISTVLKETLKNSDFIPPIESHKIKFIDEFKYDDIASCYFGKVKTYSNKNKNELTFTIKLGYVIKEAGDASFAYWTPSIHKIE